MCRVVIEVIVHLIVLLYVWANADTKSSRKVYLRSSLLLTLIIMFVKLHALSLDSRHTLVSLVLLCPTVAGLRVFNVTRSCNASHSSSSSREPPYIRS